MRFSRHVWVLTQKNYYIIKRSKIWFFCELMFALLLLPLFIFIVKNASSQITPVYRFASVRITGDKNDLGRHVNHIPRISTNMGLEKKLFGYVSANGIGDDIMMDFQQRYNHYKFAINVTKFDTVDAMKTTLLNDINATANKPWGKFIGGVHLSEINLEEKRFKYRIYVRDREGIQWHTDEFWPSDGPYGTLSDLNDIPGRPNYWSSGFLTFQFALDKLFVERTGKNTTSDVYLWRLPNPEYRSNALIAILRSTPILFMILVYVVMIHTTKEVAAEKEAGIKAHLMVMGLDSSAFYASHLITALFKMLIVVGSSTIVLCFSFESISPVVFVSFCLLFGAAAAVFSIFVTVLTHRTSLAVFYVLFFWFVLFALDAYLQISPIRVFTSIIASLNIFTAFNLGLQSMISYETRQIDLTWLKIFSGATSSFTIGTAFIMLWVDIFIFCFLIYYLDAVWPTDGAPRRSPFFLCPFIPTKEVGQNVDFDAPDNDYTDNVEPDNGVDETDISVQRMSKVWETGQVAVDGLSLNAKRGQVTVLLGHNGAGKSTTFSVISGVSAPTKGEVLICNKSVLHELEECQRKIGFCPQYNPLFEKLTVEEHLRLYGKLKVEDWNEQCEAKIRDLIAANKLTDKAHHVAGELSGGMKRKLCVAMALVGDSQVILLDEPTAGMDPGARHDISEMLKAEKKKKRTILLTTHYMDEADTLGDQIAIMVKGRLVCKGSSEYLKSRFGTGYILTVVLDPRQPSPDDTREQEVILGNIRSNLLKVIQKYARTATIENTSGSQVSIVLPIPEKAHFASLFKHLESEKADLQISSFGLAFNTLEQVFLKVGEIAEAQDHVDGQTVSRAEDLFLSDEEIASKPVQFIKQMTALVYRYAIGAYRHKVQTFFPFLLAVFAFSLVAFVQNRTGKLQQRDLSLSNQGQSLTIPMQLNQEQQIPADFVHLTSSITGYKPLTISVYEKFETVILQHAYDSPPLGIGAYVAKNNSIFLLFNGAAYHAAPLALSYLSNAMLQGKPDSIQASVEVYAPDLVKDVRQVVSPVTTIFVNILTIFCFSFFTSMFVMPLVADRKTCFKHQLLLTKLNRFTYWFSVTVWNVILYILFCLILASILLFSGWMQDCMGTNFVFWGLYFWSSVPFVYVASFIFETPLKAYVALLTWNVIGGIIASVATQVVILLGATKLAEFLKTFFSITLPSYALGYGVLEVTMQCPVLGKIVRWDNLNEVMICMAASGVFFWILLILFENTFVQMVYSIKKRLNRDTYEAIGTLDSEDEDVRNERVRMNQLPEDRVALSVRDVSKFYTKRNFGCFGIRDEVAALRNLTFGVNPTDCFGLLGINGAGKTTTFDILTGRIFASNGYAYVKGVDVRKMPSIGYCPQFDALATDLTGRQTLTILGHLNGFSDVASRVESVLENIHMQPQADKLVLHYSGGQKRRLSIGLTLMSRAPLIMLDEPTAGIDPKTRRHIWNLLSAIRQRKEVAILLTSHSMDECEALCSRIGFLNKGALISIGSSQHLKDRYGSSYLLTFTIENPSRHTRDILNEEVLKTFRNVIPTNDLETMNTYHWDIPREGNNSWSMLYERALEIANKYNIKDSFNDLPVVKDYSVTQNSLEQVFLRLTQLGATLNEQDQTRHVHASRLIGSNNV